ncbi:DUF4168 domain-containing protein [Pontibaca salina]|uniref:DUF4168 domain-containing protein n=1 Tax=Pontibaca salina TaxID=2795731 RepID=A0A934LY67_9RHOB|nr:DUF4168 domain-containing protein [Pontibaca salina]MBI6629427.1 DUF4168 domain-containing protein [Pontibaca salina]
MFNTRKITAVTLTAALMVAPVSFVAAQEATSPTQPETTQAPETSQAPAATPTPTFDDAQIDAFVNAALKVGEIQQKYGQELQGIADEAQQQALVQQADAEIRATIAETENITVEDYLAIDQAASNDEELTQKIAQRLQEIQTENAG